MVPDIIIGYGVGGTPIYQCEGRFPDESRCQKPATEIRGAFTGNDFETMRPVKFHFCAECCANWDWQPPEPTGDDVELVEDEDGFIF